MLCFRNLLVPKKFMDKTGGGGGLVSEFSVEKFWSHSAEKNSYGNPLVFH